MKLPLSFQFLSAHSICHKAPFPFILVSEISTETHWQHLPLGRRELAKKEICCCCFSQHNRVSLLIFEHNSDVVITLSFHFVTVVSNAQGSETFCVPINSGFWFRTCF